MFAALENMTLSYFLRKKKIIIAFVTMLDNIANRESTIYIT